MGTMMVRVQSEELRPKAMAVRDGESINEVALELGISSWTLR